MQLSLAFIQGKHSDYQGLLFTWEGRGFLWCCVTQSFNIRALTEGQPLFSHNEQYATASFPLHC